jgi:hypothetical protein
MNDNTEKGTVPSAAKADETGSETAISGVPKHTGQCAASQSRFTDDYLVQLVVQRVRFDLRYRKGPPASWYWLDREYDERWRRDRCGDEAERLCYVALLGIARAIFAQSTADEKASANAIAREIASLTKAIAIRKLMRSSPEFALPFRLNGVLK